MSNIGPKPSPELISFARDCFEVVGTRTVYVVTLQAPSYPKVFDSEKEAQAFAMKTGRSYQAQTTEIRRRVKWV